MVSLLENLHQFAVLLFVIIGFFYYRHLRVSKKARKLSTIEFTMYIIIQVAYIIWAGTFIILMLWA
ncbi:hypothetical protein [Paucisalibacillus globulus]|uniref:hypothetical protein n=1 Tax=Paucisalibacillus globulus TaxID=351095 RepID=UPI00041A8FCF|nr:hypothetical protein [Paucisalibacillus globulus]